MEPRDIVGESRLAGATPETASVSPRVSSPAATGGAGTTFEQHVGACWLAQLLVGAIPPVPIDTTVNEVMFQTERLGWHTDDLVIACNAGDTVPKLAGQVKRSFSVSASDAEGVQTVVDFWKDFNGQHLSKDNDRLVLVTLRGTNTLPEHFVGLLDCARAGLRRRAPPMCLLCIYGRAPLDETTTSAPAIPVCLGGRLQRQGVWCSDCNNAFAPLEETL
jgi:hypothetical protein